MEKTELSQKTTENKLIFFSDQRVIYKTKLLPEDQAVLEHCTEFFFKFYMKPELKNIKHMHIAH